MKNEDKNTRENNRAIQDSVTRAENLDSAKIDNVEYKQSTQDKSPDSEKGNNTWPQDETLQEYLEKDKGSPMKPGSLDRE